MQVSPEAQMFGPIKPLDELRKELEVPDDVDEGRWWLADPSTVLVTGEREQLEKLQEDLRKAGYRAVFNTGPLRP